MGYITSNGREAICKDCVTRTPLGMKEMHGDPATMTKLRQMPCIRCRTAVTCSPDAPKPTRR